MMKPWGRVCSIPDRDPKATLGVAVALGVVGGPSDRC
jgi:hypothetical protein